MSAIKFGEHEIQIQPIPDGWDTFTEKQIAAMFMLLYGNMGCIITTENGQRTVTWVIPPLPKEALMPGKEQNRVECGEVLSRKGRHNP